MEYQSVDLVLLTVINRMIGSLTNPRIHYLVTTSYYETADERCYFAPIYFHRNSVWNLELAEEGLSCEVLLNRTPGGERTRILIPYRQIWEVAKSRKSTFKDEDILYFNQDVRRQMFATLHKMEVPVLA